MTKAEKLRLRLYQMVTALNMHDNRAKLAPVDRELTEYYVKQARKRLRKALKRF